MANQHFARGSSDEELDGEVNMDLDTDSNAASHVAQDTHQPPILVLSRDSNLIETVRKAAQRGCQVADAPDVDRAADLLARVRPGVLLTDTAAASDVARKQKSMNLTGSCKLHQCSTIFALTRHYHYQIWKVLSELGHDSRHVASRSGIGQ